MVLKDLLAAQLRHSQRRLRARLQPLQGAGGAGEGRAGRPLPGPPLILLGGEHTFGGSSQALGQAVRLRCSALVLAVLTRAVLALAGLGDGDAWRAGRFGERRRAHAEAARPDGGLGRGGGSPTRNMLDPFLFKLPQVKLNDFFSLLQKRRSEEKLQGRDVGWNRDQSAWTKVKNPTAA